MTKTNMTCRVCKEEKPRDDFKLTGSLWAVCSNEECIRTRKTEVNELAKMKRHINRQNTSSDSEPPRKPRSVGVKTCDFCKETKPLSKFPHRGNNRYVCHQCFVDIRGRLNLHKILTMVEQKYPHVKITIAE